MFHFNEESKKKIGAASKRYWELKRQFDANK